MKDTYQLGDSIPIAIDWQENSSGSWENITLVGTAGVALTDATKQTVLITKICTDDADETTALSNGVAQTNIAMFKDATKAYRSVKTIQGIDVVGNYKAICVYDSQSTTDGSIEPLQKTVVYRFEIIDEA